MNVLFKKYTLKDYGETVYKDAKRDTAKNLMMDGYSDEKVQQYTGLSNLDIENLRKELKLKNIRNYFSNMYNKHCL